MAAEWPFDQVENTAVLTTHYVLELGHPIVRAVRDVKDGAWQFHAAEGAAGAVPKVVGLGEMVEADASLLELADLPAGWVATRPAPGWPWERQPNG